MNLETFNSMPLPRRVRTTKKWKKFFCSVVFIPAFIVGLLPGMIAASEKGGGLGAFVYTFFILFLYFSLLCAALFSWFFYFKPIKMMKRGMMAEAKVVDVQGYKRTYAYVEFTTAEKGSGSTKVETESLLENPKRGDKIRVLYDPAKPESAVVFRESLLRWWLVS